MKKTNLKKSLSLLVCMVLVAAMALTVIGCKDNQINNTLSSGVVEIQSSVKFTFIVLHKDGSENTFDITTDKATVGEALQSKGLIDGEEGPYGIFVKTVDDETLDYNADGYWWAFYIEGEQAMTGADKTPIESGKTYSFKAEKA